MRRDIKLESFCLLCGSLGKAETEQADEISVSLANGFEFI